jgi:Flp pilus assembly protein TadG
MAMVGRAGTGGREARPGQGVVELALLMPVLALILLGAIDLGRVFIYHERLTNAVREGAIYGTRVPDPGAIASRAYAETANQLGTTGVGMDFQIDPTKDIIFYDGATTSPLAPKPDAGGTVKPSSGDTVEVTGRYRFRPLTSMIIRVLPASFTLRKSVRMVIQ